MANDVKPCLTCLWLFVYIIFEGPTYQILCPFLYWLVFIIVHMRHTFWALDSNLLQMLAFLDCHFIHVVVSFETKHLNFLFKNIELCMYVCVTVHA